MINLNMKDMSDDEIVGFYLEHKENNTDAFQRWRDEERLKAKPLFREAKNWFWDHKNDIFQDIKNIHLRRSKERLGE